MLYQKSANNLLLHWHESDSRGIDRRECHVVLGGVCADGEGNSLLLANSTQPTLGGLLVDFRGSLRKRQATKQRLAALFVPYRSWPISVRARLIC